jgi:hypothetical protein
MYKTIESFRPGPPVEKMKLLLLIRTDTDLIRVADLSGKMDLNPIFLVAVTLFFADIKCRPLEMGNLRIGID